MPIVPTFKPNTNLEAMPGVRQQNNATPQTFGSGVADATAQAGAQLKQTGGELSQLGAQIQQRQDSIEAKDAYQRASEDLRTFMHDPKTGLFSLRAGDARGLTNRATKGLDEIRSRHTKNLTPAQRDLFERFWQGTQDSSITSAARHEFEQMKESEDNTNKAIIDNAESMIAANYRDPKTIEHHVQVGLSTIASMTKGQSQDVYDMYVRTFKSKAYGAVVARYLVDDQSEEAAKFLAEHEKEIDGKLADQLRQDVQRKGALVEVQKAADEIKLKYPNANDEAKAMEEVVKKYPSGEKRTLLEQRVQAIYVDAHRFDQERLKQQLENAANTMMNAPTLEQAERQLANEKNPEILPHLRQIINLRFQKDLEARQMAKSAALAEAAAIRAEKRQQVREDRANEKYAAVVRIAEAEMFGLTAGAAAPGTYGPAPTNLGQITPEKFAEALNRVRAQFPDRPLEGERAAEVLKQRMNEHLAIQKPAPEDSLNRAIAEYQILTQVRKEYDESLDKGQPLSPARVQMRIVELSSSADPRRPVVTPDGLRRVMKYVEEGGKVSGVTQDQIETKLKNMVGKDLDGKDADIAKYPFLVDQVSRAIPAGTEKVTDDMLGKIMAPLLLKSHLNKGYIWDTTIRATNAGGEIGKLEYNEIPDVDRRIMRSMLTTSPIKPATDAQVNKLYGQVYGAESSLNPGPASDYAFIEYLKRTYPNLADRKDIIDSPTQIQREREEYNRKLGKVGAPANAK